MTDPDLIRFVEAQASVYHRVVEELTAGHKQTHWMWFVFPQLAGLGHSTTAERYDIRNLDQAKRYLADPTLGDRLRQDVRLIMRHKGKSALQILGTPDDLKFQSCLTLFGSSGLRTTPIGRCSMKPWLSSMRVSQIRAPNSCLF